MNLKPSTLRNILNPPQIHRREGGSSNSAFLEMKAELLKAIKPAETIPELMTDSELLQAIERAPGLTQGELIRARITYDPDLHPQDKTELLNYVQFREERAKKEKNKC